MAIITAKIMTKIQPTLYIHKADGRQIVEERPSETIYQIVVEDENSVRTYDISGRLFMILQVGDEWSER